MKHLPKYIPFHFLIGLICGILLQYYTKFFSIELLLICVSISVLSLGLFYILKKKIGFTIQSVILFFFIGITTTFTSNPKNKSNYFEKVSKKNSIKIIEITKKLIPNPYNHKYEGNVIQIESFKTTGKVLINIEKDTLAKPLEIGNQIVTTIHFSNISKPKNPYDFDYADYLLKKGIHKQIYLQKREFITLPAKTSSLYAIAERIRTQIQTSLVRHNFSKEVYGVINALLLGNRNAISKKLREDFINAGAIHILAISGLHIGILLYILLFLLKPIERIQNGKLIKSVLIIFLLWSFALITGLSASVVRAVTMFTVITIGQHLNKKTLIEHSLISSMLLLLLIQPLYIFDIGFQLSYLAVFGIVWIQRLFKKLYYPKNKIVRFFWNIITVSIAAQIGILPLSLFYFHQFPSLFLISNIVILPVLGGILGLGIFTIICSVTNINLQWIYDFFEWIISQLNRFINFVSGFEDFILKNISINFYQMISWYVFIFFGIKFINKINYKNCISLLSSILLIQGIYFYNNHKVAHQNELIVFHKSKTSLIGITKGTSLKILSNNKSSKAIQNYITAKNIKTIQNDSISNILKFKNNTILIIDSLGIYNLPELKNTTIILKSSPKINLDRMIDILNPKIIIADGSNYKSYVTQWKQTCVHKKTPFHSTYENGAYIVFPE